eukprot:TRINITY_DN84880_c0_g1_i1.p1 TRINITY_DN84880_c0_g1~~TRINITY_DN84880_c0_g1_i1.p1  ORF type:complete len:148 (-),score=6.98 TRINITY_DN84880_c0_g1_i1:209-628(-)
MAEKLRRFKERRGRAQTPEEKVDLVLDVLENQLAQSTNAFNDNMSISTLFVFAAFSAVLCFCTGWFYYKVAQKRPSSDFPDFMWKASAAWSATSGACAILFCAGLRISLNRVCEWLWIVSLVVSCVFFLVSLLSYVTTK